MSDLRFDLGSLDLVSADGGSDSYRFALLADGFAPGSPDAVKEIVSSALLDGDDSRITRYGNMSWGFKVAVFAPDSAGLRAGKQALRLELGKGRLELKWTLPDGFSDPLVFDVLNGTMAESDFDDLNLVRDEKCQVWALDLECLPWERPEDLTTVAFVPGAGTPTTVDNGSSLTNWSVDPSSAYPGAVSTSTWLTDAAIKFHLGGTVTEPLTAAIRWTGTVPATNFIALDLAADNVTNLTAISYVQMNGANPVGYGPGVVSGFSRYYFANTGAMPVFTVWLSPTVAGTATDLTFYMSGLYSSATIPSTGLLVAGIGGAVRTTGSLTVARAGTRITDLMIYSDAAMMVYGYTPDLPSSWASAPSARLQGDGASSYMFYASRSDLSSPTTNDVITLTVRGQTLRTLIDSSTPPAWIPVGQATLGGGIDGRVGSFAPVLKKNGSTVSSPTIRMLRVAEGETALTYLHNGTGYNSVVLECPSLAYPQGGLFGDGADILDASITESWGWPQIAPPTSSLWVTPDTPGSAVTTTLTYYERG